MSLTLPACQYIRSNSALLEASDTWSQVPWVGIDTEFLRERTFYAVSGLIQLATPDHYFLIDPIEVSDFSPLIELFECRQTVKVIHSGSEDLELFNHTLNTLPTPLFDTQIAAAFLGQGLSVSYKNLVHSCCHVNLNKEEQRSDWTQRPLSEQQLEYALQDVLYLGQLYCLQHEALQQKKILDWVQQDCQSLLTSVLHEEDPGLAYQRVKGAATLTGKELARLQVLAQWREKEAIKANLPKGFLIRDPQLLTLVQQNPTHFNGLKTIEGLHPRSLRRYGQLWLDLLAGTDPKLELALLPNERLPKEAKPIIKAIRHLLAERAADYDIAAELFMNRKKLNLMVGNWLEQRTVDLTRFLPGWRYEVLSGPLNQLFQELST